MGTGDIETKREALSLLSDLCKAVRFCRRDSVLCEDITLTQFFVLDAIEEKEELLLVELHRILAVDKSTTTRLLNPLIKQGLVQREKVKKDQRAVNLTLTDEGKETHGKVRSCIVGFIKTVNEGIPEEKRADVYDNLKLFVEAVQSLSSCQCR